MRVISSPGGGLRKPLALASQSLLGALVWGALVTLKLWVGRCQPSARQRPVLGAMLPAIQVRFWDGDAGPSRLVDSQEGLRTEGEHIPSPTRALGVEGKTFGGDLCASGTPSGMGWCRQAQEGPNPQSNASLYPWCPLMVGSTGWAGAGSGGGRNLVPRPVSTCNSSHCPRGGSTEALLPGFLR